jgi:hypothetical protein
MAKKATKRTKKAVKKVAEKKGVKIDKTPSNGKSPKLFINPEIHEDKEFRDLLPPLASDVRKALEDSIHNEGLRDPLVGWKEDGKLVLVDGYNRIKFCRKHGKDYRVIVKSFNDRNEVKEWMWENQESRRNMTPFQRIEVVLKFEGVIKEQAKAQQRKGKRKSEAEGCEIVNNPKDNGPKVSRARVEQIRTNEVLGNRAGVSYATVGKVLKIKEMIADGVVSQEELDALREGRVTINKIYNLHKDKKTKQQSKPDIAKRSNSLLKLLKMQVTRYFTQAEDRNLIYKQISEQLSEWANNGDDVSLEQE